MQNKTLFLLKLIKKMGDEKKGLRKKIVKLKLPAEELKKRRLENLKKANEARRKFLEQKKLLKQQMEKEEKKTKKEEKDDETKE